MGEIQASVAHEKDTFCIGILGAPIRTYPEFSASNVLPSIEVVNIGTVIWIRLVRIIFKAGFGGGYVDISFSSIVRA